MSDPVQREQTSSTTADDDRQSPDEVDDDHLSNLEDGAGCTEIWEHLSERRADANARTAENADD